MWLRLFAVSSESLTTAVRHDDPSRAGANDADAEGFGKGGSVSEHIAIDPQPELYPDGSWPIHEPDAAGKWFRPAGRIIPGAGPYPLFDTPSSDVKHAWCKQCGQWEWVSPADCEGNFPTRREAM